jgi:small neutral amino acid transporter SnatA (MarC family)
MFASKEGQRLIRTLVFVTAMWVSLTVFYAGYWLVTLLGPTPTLVVNH